MKLKLNGSLHDKMQTKSYLIIMFHNQIVNTLVIDFHNLEKRVDELKDIIESIDDKLSLVHIHGNNWDGRLLFDGNNRF